MTRNNHLQRFLNANRKYLVNELLQDKYILDILCYIYLLNKATTIECLILYFTNETYSNSKSITHLKDVIKTLYYFKLIKVNGKIIKLDRLGIQYIEQKQNITRATTSLDYSYLNQKGIFITDSLNLLKGNFNKNGYEFNLIDLCRIDEQSKAIGKDIIITKYNIVIMFNSSNTSKKELNRKVDILLKSKLVNIDKKINILINREFYLINKTYIENIFQQYQVNFIYHKKY